MHQCEECKVKYSQGMLKVVEMLNSAETFPVLLDVFFFQVTLLLELS